MTYLEIFFLAIALSIDSCVVSFTYGLNNYDSKTRRCLAFVTGAFQGLMPVLGYYFTKLIYDFLAPYSKLIVFIIFLYLGIRFIIESFKQVEKERDCITLMCLLLIGIATSIDAFSAGISLMLSGNYILKPALLIALVTFVNSNLGFLAGKKLKHIPAKYMGIISGIILIVLGIKALF